MAIYGKPIETNRWEHHGVKPDGTFEHEAGAVRTKPFVAISAPQGGCGSRGCNCSPGHWIAIGEGRTKEGVVKGKTIHFRSHEEMMLYKKEHKLRCSRGG